MEGLIVRIATVLIVVAAVLVGMSFAAINSDTTYGKDILEALSFDIVVPQLTLTDQLTLTGQAADVFAQTPAEVPVEMGCTETDEGDDSYTLGVVMSVSAEGTRELVDVCEGDALHEYYCDGAHLRNYTKLCLYGCWQGICRNTPVQTSSGVISIEEQRINREDMQTVYRALEPRWIEPEDILPTCKNAFKDGKETDVDCGGPCKPCSYSQMCKQNADCEPDLFCNYRSRRCLKTKY